jgi:hypothetical protein
MALEREYGFPIFLFRFEMLFKEVERGSFVYTINWICFDYYGCCFI